MTFGNFDRFRYYAALNARTNKHGPLHTPVRRLGGAHHASGFGGSHRSRSIAAGQEEAAKRLARVRAALEGSERRAAEQLLSTFATQVLGKTEGGPGVWESSPTRAKGADYQEQISGVVRGVEYDVPFAGVASGKVRFDGYDAQRKVLLDAKDWQGWPPDGQSFWEPGTFKDAVTQINAAKGTPIEWHFSSQRSLDEVKDLFEAKRITQIKLVLTQKP